MKATRAGDDAGEMEALFAEHFLGHQQVAADAGTKLAPAAAAAGNAIIESLGRGGKIICFGNGGSATQASHMAGELVGRFRLTRRPFPAVSLASDGGTMTCIGNDFGYPALFERQMEAFAQPGDVAIGLTTSGKSENVIRALAVARLTWRSDDCSDGFPRSRHRRRRPCSRGAQHRHSTHPGSSPDAPSRLVHRHRRRTSAEIESGQVVG